MENGIGVHTEQRMNHSEVAPVPRRGSLLKVSEESLQKVQNTIAEQCRDLESDRVQLSVRELTRRTGLAPGTVLKALNALESTGVIQRVSSGIRRQANTYIYNAPLGARRRARPAEVPQLLEKEAEKAASGDLQALGATEADKPRGQAVSTPDATALVEALRELTATVRALQEETRRTRDTLGSALRWVQSPVVMETRLPGGFRQVIVRDMPGEPAEPAPGNLRPLESAPETFSAEAGPSAVSVAEPVATGRQGARKAAAVPARRGRQAASRRRAAGTAVPTERRERGTVGRRGRATAPAEVPVPPLEAAELAPGEAESRPSGAGTTASAGTGSLPATTSPAQENVTVPAAPARESIDWADPQTADRVRTEGELIGESGGLSTYRFGDYDVAINESGKIVMATDVRSTDIVYMDVYAG